MLGFLFVTAAIQQQLISSSKNKQKQIDNPPAVKKTTPQQAISSQNQQQSSLFNRYKQKHLFHQPTSKINFKQLKLPTLQEKSSNSKLLSQYNVLRTQQSLNKIYTNFSFSRLDKTINILSSLNNKVLITLILDKEPLEINNLFVKNLTEEFDINKFTPIYSFIFSLPLNIFNKISSANEKIIKIEIYNNQNKLLFNNEYEIIDLIVKEISSAIFLVEIKQLEKVFIKMLNDYDFMLFEKTSIQDTLKTIATKYNLQIESPYDMRQTTFTLYKFTNMNVVNFLKILQYYQFNKDDENIIYKQYIRDNVLYFVHDKFYTESINIDYEKIRAQNINFQTTFNDKNSVIYMNNLNHNFFIFNQFENKITTKQFNIQKNNFKSYKNYFIFSDLNDEYCFELKELKTIQYHKQLLKNSFILYLVNAYIPNIKIFTPVKIENLHSTPVYKKVIGYTISTNIQFNKINNEIKLYLA